MLRAYKFRFANLLWCKANPILVDHQGKDMGAIRQIIRALKDQDVVGVFPEGGLQREGRKLQEFAPECGPEVSEVLRFESFLKRRWHKGSPGLVSIEGQIAEWHKKFKELQ